MTARALVCLTWTVLTFVFSFFLFLLECVAAPSVKRTLFLSALREHTNVACFSTTLFNPVSAVNCAACRQMAFYFCILDQIHNTRVN